MTHLAKRRRQLVVALGDPSQGRIGSPIVAGSSNRCRSSSSVGSFVVRPRAAAAFAPHLSRQRIRVLQVLQTASDRAAGDLRRARRRRNPPASPPPSPPPPRSIDGPARPVRNEALHSGRVQAFRRSSTKHRPAQLTTGIPMRTSESKTRPNSAISGRRLMSAGSLSVRLVHNR